LNHIFIARAGGERAASIAAPAAYGCWTLSLLLSLYYIRPAIHAKLFSPIHVNQFVFTPLASWLAGWGMHCRGCGFSLEIELFLCCQILQFIAHLLLCAICI
jgi:hypothetical protein